MDPILTVGDPVRVRGRGRPAGAPNRIRAERSTRRERSRFELQLGEGRPRRCIRRPRRVYIRNLFFFFFFVFERKTP